MSASAPWIRLSAFGGAFLARLRMLNPVMVRFWVLRGSIRAYLASFPDANAASADMRRRFKFLGDTGVWRLLTSAARDIGG